MKSIVETTVPALKDFLSNITTLKCVMFVPTEGFVSRSAPFDFDARRLNSDDDVSVSIDGLHAAVGSIMFDLDTTTRVFMFIDNDSRRYLHIFAKFYSTNNGVKFFVNIPFLDFDIHDNELYKKLSIPV